MNTNRSENIRVPSNTHPSHIVNPSSSSMNYIDEEEEFFYSAYGTPASRPQSIRASIQQFAGSYSRASVLYVADALSTSVSYYPPSITTTDYLPEDQETSCLYKTQSLQFAQDNNNPNKAYRTFSHQPNQQTLEENTDSKKYPSSFVAATTTLSRNLTVGSIISDQLSNSVMVPHNNFNKLESNNAADPTTVTVIPTKSSYVQSVFNAVNVLVGVGILALPLSFRLAGWFYGSLVFLFCCFSTCYTAKIIVKCLNTVSASGGGGEHSGTYGDMGQIAFGDKGKKLISTVFVVELITIGVAMIILLGDGIQSLFPLQHFTILQTRVMSFCILLPTVFLPIKKLAYTSLIGIIGCFSLVVIVFYDGMTKMTKPGSLYDPMETEIVVADAINLPLSFGLIMSGFAGHAVFPSIYRDMESPSKYNRMVNFTYFVTAVIYTFMAVIGYLMFGQEALQEITQNLAMIDEYNKTLNKFAIWLLVLTPVAKYGIMMQPLNLSWELYLFNHQKIESWLKLRNNAFRKSFIVTLGRTIVTAGLVYIALVFPGFDKVMSLLGALFSFTISIIFPLICHLQLYKSKLSVSETIFNWLLLSLAIIMASVGTVWSFMPVEL